MSFNEIKKLRQEGRIEDALTIAKTELEANPNDIWAKRAISWVYYEYIKIYKEQGNYELFKENLKNIIELELPETEKMIFEKTAWKVGGFVKQLGKTKNIDYSKVNELYEFVKKFHFNKPSKEFSYIYQSFHKVNKNWTKYLEFADWWNFDNFMEDDYNSSEYNDKKIMPLVEQAYISYAKHLLKGNKKYVDTPLGRVYSQQNSINVEKIKQFLLKLDSIINNHHNYQYLIYVKVKLLAAIGEKETALKFLLPFAQKNKNKFWVWDLLSDLNENEENKISLLSYAILIEKNEKYLVKLRFKLAKLFIKKELYDNAKSEIDIIKQTRLNNGWKIPNEIQQITEENWYKQANNKQIDYKKLSKNVLETIYPLAKSLVVVISSINQNRNQIYFIKNKTTYGKFNLYDDINLYKQGDIVEIKYIDKKDTYYKTISIKKLNKNTEIEALKNFTGTIRIHFTGKFAFVDDVFIPNKYLTRNIQNGQLIKGVAILSYNNKKDEYGWVAIELTSL